ncbi:MAG TPA: DUF502 domain-containing protein [Thermoanaerobaculia bacterium]|jgi:uncharacterized membrane protein|nr:DUF502 domain-containing protein [Thermoanaerobaculia bacterium]
MNWLLKNFLRGLIIVVPIAMTIYILYEIFIRLDRLLTLPTPGLGLLILLAATVLIGALASNFVGRNLLRLTEAVFTRAPIVRIIYAAIKDLLEAFVGDKKRFDKPVAVSLTAAADIRALGFVTQEDLAFLSLPGEVAVYLPFSYSIAGAMVIVPRARVERLEANSASIMALVVSGGVSRV